MTIKITKSDRLWSVTWTTDGGATWATTAYDSFYEAITHARRIGEMRLNNVAR